MIIEEDEMVMQAVLADMQTDDDEITPMFLSFEEYFPEEEDEEED